MRKSAEFKQEAVELVNKILETLTSEQIAVKVGRSAHCIYTWSKGKSSPSFGDYVLLKKIYNKEE